VWHVYVIQSETKGVLYTGITKDLERRLREHNTSQTRSARYTRTGGRRPWKLVHLEGPFDLPDALRRERVIKKMTRIRKLDLIQASR